MICKCGDEYISYFRRNELKFNWLLKKQRNKNDRNKLEKELRKELSADTEWVRYQRDRVQYIPEGWLGVYAECLIDNSYPFLVFYEKEDRENPYEMK